MLRFYSTPQGELQFSMKLHFTYCIDKIGIKTGARTYNMYSLG